MRIRSFEVYGLFGREGKISGDFSDDLNILTGRNGAGKTTLLKLLWYIISGNILVSLNEINFQRAKIVTDEYECIVIKLNRNTCRVELIVDGEKHIIEDELDERGDVISNAEDVANHRIKAFGGSVFFPTFRRIEGGFTLNTFRGSPFGKIAPQKSDIEEALVSLSRRLSHDSHIFVSAISTVDIVNLLLRQYADLSEVSNSLQQETSQQLIETIKAFKADRNDDTQIDSPSKVLDEIRFKIENMEAQREQVMIPFDAIRKMVERLFKHSGIKIGSKLNFGDAANAINSDALSAGEKQMLSFICYNAFYKNSIIFIDEPELSLHVDWQRRLFPILKSQQTSNQFVIATHSPFIYSKYPDKEVCINIDRGDEEVE